MYVQNSAAPVRGKAYTRRMCGSSHEPAVPLRACDAVEKQQRLPLPGLELNGVSCFAVWRCATLQCVFIGDFSRVRAGEHKMEQDPPREHGRSL
jgi:hypothetical protein